MTSTENHNERPYSQKELQNNRNNTLRTIRLGKVWARHSICNHSYLTKINGRKEKEIMESSNSDSGNCSVCWKLKKIPRQSKDNINDLVDLYMKQQSHDCLTNNNVNNEIEFYKWLYVNSF
jgi:hypothetical protein